MLHAWCMVLVVLGLRSVNVSVKASHIRQAEGAVGSGLQSLLPENKLRPGQSGERTDTGRVRWMPSWILDIEMAKFKRALDLVEIGQLVGRYQYDQVVGKPGATCNKDGALHWWLEKMIEETFSFFALPLTCLRVKFGRLKDGYFTHEKTFSVLDEDRNIEGVFSNSKMEQFVPYLVQMSPCNHNPLDSRYEWDRAKIVFQAACLPPEEDVGFKGLAKLTSTVDTFPQRGSTLDAVIGCDAERAPVFRLHEREKCVEARIGKITDEQFTNVKTKHMGTEKPYWIFSPEEKELHRLFRVEDYQMEKGTPHLVELKTCPSNSQEHGYTPRVLYKRAVCQDTIFPLLQNVEVRQRSIDWQFDYSGKVAGYGETLSSYPNHDDVLLSIYTHKNSSSLAPSADVLPQQLSEALKRFTRNSGQVAWMKELHRPDFEEVRDSFEGVDLHSVRIKAVARKDRESTAAKVHVWDYVIRHPFQENKKKFTLAHHSCEYLDGERKSCKQEEDLWFWNTPEVQKKLKISTSKCSIGAMEN